MRSEDLPPFLRVVDAVRNFIGYFVLLAFAVAFLAIGDTAARIIGAAFMSVWIPLGLRTLHKRRDRDG